ncbi:UPF0158 family protein [Methanospirillum hungatei]|uniref:UPF0158 family protein n=1 Tax=Methanospirillum hungatei TaxID=2203 RepID=UPI0026EC574D|nr:UPF0158 family protein [Methanospirillum hungatei]MCA1916814.1 UPF0158 family protein [Methanospirillum hungatei]
MGNSMVKNIDVKKRVVHLSLDEIAEALDNCTLYTRYILDLQEEEIIRLSEYMMSSDEIQEVFDEIDDDETGRYVLFPIRMGSRDGYADMEVFIENIKDLEVQELANQVIRESKPFRRFKDFIQVYPDLEKEWYTWKDARSRNRALEWLEEEGLVLTNEE